MAYKSPSSSWMMSPMSLLLNDNDSKISLLGLSTFIFFALNYVRLTYQEKDKSSLLEDLQCIMTMLNKLLKNQVSSNEINRILSNVTILLNQTPIKEIKDIYRSINGVKLFKTPDVSTPSSSSSSSSDVHLTTPPSLNIDDVDFGSLLKSEMKPIENNITVDIIEDLEYLVSEINDKNFKDNVQRYIDERISSPKSIRIEDVTLPHSRLKIEINELVEEHLIGILSPHRESEPVFTYENNEICIPESNSMVDDVGKIRTPMKSNSFIYSPIDISTVKTNKSRRSRILTTIASKNTPTVSLPTTPNSVLSELTQNHTPTSVLSELTQNESIINENNVMTPCSVRSEFSESKIVGFSTIKQLPMELMDYSLDSDWGQGSDIEESPVKPIRNSTMTKITRTTRATSLQTGPTPIQFFSYKDNNENLNYNLR